MKKLLTSILLGKTLVLILLMMASVSVIAQTPSYFNTNVAGGANSFPFNNATTSRKVQWFIPPNSLAGAFAGNITTVYFQAGSTITSKIYPQINISMKQGSGTGLTSIVGQPFEPGLTNVFTGINYNLATVSGQWFSFTLTAPFNYDPSQPLIVEVEHNSPSTGGPTVQQQVNIPGPGNGRQWGDYAGTSVVGIGLQQVNFGVDIIPSGPCNTSPSAGTATVAPTGAVCSGTAVSLNLVGASYGTGQTYQWQSSLTPSGPFNNVGPLLTLTPFLSTNPTSTLYYQCVVTCAPGVSTSNQLFIPVNQPLSGLYTINNTAATAGNNFNTFTEAINAVNCGVVGHVTFNVSAGQSFSEDTPPLITNSNVSNTITFQRAGAGANPVIRPTGTTGTTDAGITIFGSDYITFDGIDIQAASGNLVEFGYYVRNNTATDGAQNNTIKNCSISLDRTNLNSRGIYQNVAVTPTAATGANSNNTYLNINISNVYAGVYFLGNATNPDLNTVLSTAACGQYNLIGDPNVPNDLGNLTTTLVFGIRASNQSGFTISNNKVSNIGATTAATDGILIELFQGLCSLNNNIVNEVNRSGSSTVNVTGMRFTHSTLAGSHTLRVFNNSISNITSAYTLATATRGLRGMHVSGTGGTNAIVYEIYNNNIHLNNSAFPGISNACYEHSTSTAGPAYIIKNNIFANYTSVKTCVSIHYGFANSSSATVLGTAGTDVSNNDIFVSSDAGVTGFTAVGVSTTYNGVAAWQNANSLATANIEADPQFVNPANANLHANNLAALNGTAATYPAYITIDLDCALRDLPADIGAYNLEGCSGTPSGGSAVTSSAFICPGQDVNLTVTGQTIAAGLSYQWTSSSSMGGPYTPIANAITPGYTTDPINITTYFKLEITCTITSQTGTSSPVAVNVLAAPTATVTPAGPLAGCQGTITLTASTNAVTPSYQWKFNGNDITGATGATHVPALSGSYSVEISDQAAPTQCPNLSNSVNAVIDPAPPLLTFPTTTTICGGTSAQLNATISASGVITTPLVPNNGSAAVGFDLTNTSALPITVNFISYTSSAALGGIANTTVYYMPTALNCVFPTNPSTLPWINLGTVSAVSAGAAPALTLIPLDLNITVPPGQTYAFGFSGASVRYTNGLGGCPIIASDANINVKEGFGGTWTSSITPRNFTGSISYSFGDPNTNVTWSPSLYLNNPNITNPLATPPVGTHTYTATATGLNGCTSTASVTVNVLPVPPAPTLTAGTPTCGFGTVILSATGTGNPGSVIRWYGQPMGGSILGTGPSFVTPVISQNTLFYATEYDGVQCEGPRASLEAVSTPAPPMTLNNSLPAICDGSTASSTLSITTGNPGYSFQWSSGQTTSSITVTPASTTTYTVTATDGGCVNIATTTVGVGVTPTINNVTTSLNNFCEGNSTQLNVAAILPGFPTSQSGFAGAFGPGTWTTTNIPAGVLGSVNTSGAPASITIISGDALVAGTTRFSHPVLANGIITFNWSYTTVDGAEFDYPQYSINGVSTIMPGYSTIGLSTQSGTASIPVLVGQTFGLEMFTLDGDVGPGQVVISNIAFPLPAGSGSISYLWSPTGSLNNVAIANPIATPPFGTTLYTVVVSNSGCNTSTSISIVANPTPAAPAVQNASRCGLGPVTVGATIAGTPRWVKSNAGGQVYNVGSSTYTTNITTTTNFYVVDDPGSALTNFGPANPNVIGTPSAAFFTGNWENFNVLTANGIILDAVDVFFTGAVGSQYIIVIENNVGFPLDTIIGTTTVTGGLAQTVSIGTWLPAGTGYRIRFALNPGANRAIGSTAYPYTIPGQISWTGNNFGPDRMYFFYNWSVRTGCFSPVATVTGTVTPPPALNITAGGPATFCGSGSVQLTATNTSYVNHSWTPTAGLSPTTGNVVTATVSETTTYTVIANDGDPVNGCAASASFTVTVEPLPLVNISPVAINPVCPGTPVQLDANASSGSFKQIGNTRDFNLTEIGIYNGANVSSRAMMLYTKAELNAAGLFGPTDISKIGFEVALKGSNAPYNGFTINMGATALTALTATYPTTSMTTVFNGTVSSVTGWNTHNFSTNFAWDGNSNVLVDICFTNTTTSIFDFVFVTPTVASTYLFGNGGPCGVATGVASVNRPNTRFTGGPVNYSWNQASLLSSTTIANPIATSSILGNNTFVVTVTDPANLCFNTASVSYNVSTTPAQPVATITGDNDFCQSGSTTLQMSGSTGNIQWQSSPDGNVFANIPSANAATYNTGVITSTTHYRVVTECGNSSTSTPVVVVINDPQIVSSIAATRCGYGTVDLSATATAGANIKWYDAPSGGASLFTGNAFTTPAINNTTTFYAEPVLGLGGTDSVAVPLATGSTTGVYYHMFVVNSPTGLTMSGMAIKCNMTIGALSAWDIYYRPDNYQLIPGANTSGAGWILLSSVTNVPSQGANEYTYMSLGLNLTIPAGATYSFHIAPAAGTTHQYGSTALGTVVASNANASIIAGNRGSGLFNCTTTSGIAVVKLLYSVGCVGPRMPVIATVTPPPAMTISPAVSICTNQTATLNVLSGSGDYTTFNWSPADGLNTTSGLSVIANPAVTTTYTVISSGASNNCQNIATVTVTVLNTPVPIATSTDNVLCAGSPITITGVNAPVESTIGTGTVSTSTYGPITKASATTTVHYNRNSYRFTAAELAAAGVVSGAPISTVSWNKITAFTFAGANTATMEIYLKNSAVVAPYVASTPWSTYNAGATLVATHILNASNFPAVAGWVPFSVTPFVYTGGDLEVQVVFAMNAPLVSPFTGGAFNWQYTSGLPTGITGYASSSVVQSGATTLTVTTIRPNIMFTQSFESGAWSGGGIAALPLVQTFNPPVGSNVYTYTVTNNVTGCVESAAINVLVEAIPTPVVTQTAGTNPLCLGASATLSSGYSDPSFAYTWSNFNNQPDITVSAPGNYSVTVTTSQAGCVGVSAPFALKRNVLSATSVVTSNYNGAQVSCFGASDGSFVINAQSLIVTPPVPSPGPLQYAVNGGPFQASNSFTGLPAGTHSFTVNDLTTGCSFTGTRIITSPTQLSVSTVINNMVGCNGQSNGSATANPTGGTGPYAYIWNTPVPKEVQTNNEIPAGTWTVTVTDVNGCTATASVTITQPNTLTVSLGDNQLVAYGTNGFTGCTNLVAATLGGTMPYAYVWTNVTSTTTLPSVTGTQQVCNPAGNTVDITQTYQVVVTDANGCTATATVIVLFANVNCSTPGTTKIKICHVPNGNPGGCKTLCVAPDSWPGLLGGSPLSYLGKCKPNCAQPVRMNSDAPEGLKTDLNVYPNPTTGRVRIEYISQWSEAQSVVVIDLQGRVVMEIQTESELEFQSELDLSHLNNGIYFINVMNKGAMVISAKVIKSE